jgi:hypothetical protein
VVQFEFPVVFFAPFANPLRTLRLKALKLLTAKIAKESRKVRKENEIEIL